MSVIFYDPNELANLASVVVGNYVSSDGKGELTRTLNALVRYSVENAQAYQETYGNKVEGWSYEMLRAGIRPAANIEQHRRAHMTLDGLRYNLVSNAGKDFASAETLDGLLSIAVRMNRRHRGA